MLAKRLGFRNAWRKLTLRRSMSTTAVDAAAVPFTRSADYPGLKASIDRMKAEGHQLAFAWVTPRALTKGLEGGILARLLSVPGTNLMGARMYAPSEQFISDYIEAHKQHHHPRPFGPFAEYLETLRPSHNEQRGYPNHMLLLLLTGKNVRENLMNAIGEQLPDLRRRDVGRTIRGAYGFYRIAGPPGSAVAQLAAQSMTPTPSNSPLPSSSSGASSGASPHSSSASKGSTKHASGASSSASATTQHYGWADKKADKKGEQESHKGEKQHHKEHANIYEFEPACVGAQNDVANNAYLKIFAKYAETDGGVLIDESEWKNTGMVMIKPDLLVKPSSKPGHIMDLFSSTGLHLVAARLFSMSIADAQNFYGHLEPIFAKKLAPNIDAILRRRLDGAFDFPLSDPVFDVMTAMLKKDYAQAEVAKIIEFMTGVKANPDMKDGEREKRGTARCFALLYHGENAIETIRNKLGSTDPRSALVGTIRSDYGSDVMRNGAHASDSLESLQRERLIVGFKETRAQRVAHLQDGAFRPSAVKAIIDIWTENK